jgi:hypothetical protein
MEMLFKPQYANANEIIITKYNADFKGLRFELDGTHLTISNSLHKFYKGNNYSDFTYHEILQAIKRIEEITGISADKFSIKKLEIGVNIITKIDINKIIDAVVSYKKKYFFKDMEYDGLVYGKKVKLSEYLIKLYNKTKECWRHNKVRIKENLLRVEIRFNKSRLLRGITNLEDLKSRESLNILSEILIKDIQSTIMNDLVDLSQLDSNNTNLYFAGLNPNFWLNEMRVSRDRGKQKKKDFDKLAAKVFVKGHKLFIINELRDKFYNLIYWGFPRIPNL